MSLIGLDLFDFVKGIVLLALTSGATYAIGKQFFSSNYCAIARIIQALLLFASSFLFDSAGALILGVIVLIIGVGNYLAETNSKFAFLDPNLA
ncbi:hypothetical protein [Acidianus bottle-shaped virus]|uniref:Putative transmembrane protein ORF92 n=1 Tax=Acidianus bottle-shaped virus (isolate Italy/Pozzuoli) TaxID=654911 RepID=Y092_ABVP|nr:hypothetical protein ABV_gp27 [Acidianus bottle-shaped virus]A4ZUB3.1 RecName: Full=Putative transmembrane protein ORF92 [Acidianus bottle-shaped virus (isolate Pozzuoli)]ABP73417.1 hypothetical protein [Acidianus bottle-shaped virus]